MREDNENNLQFRNHQVKVYHKSIGRDEVGISTFIFTILWPICTYCNLLKRWLIQRYKCKYNNYKDNVSSLQDFRISIYSINVILPECFINLSMYFGFLIIEYILEIICIKNIKKQNPTITIIRVSWKSIMRNSLRFSLNVLMPQSPKAIDSFRIKLYELIKLA